MIQMGTKHNPKQSHTHSPQPVHPQPFNIYLVPSKKNRPFLCTAEEAESTAFDFQPSILQRGRYVQERECKEMQQKSKQSHGFVCYLSPFLFPPLFCCKERVYYKNEQECKPWIKEAISKEDSIKSQNLQEEAVKQYPKILRGRKKYLGQNKAAAQKQMISAGYSNNLQCSEGPALTGKCPLHAGLSGLGQCAIHIENLMVKTKHVSSHILFQSLSPNPTFLIIYRLNTDTQQVFLDFVLIRLMQYCHFASLSIQL